jgi:hypothetical protein
MDKDKIFIWRLHNHIKGGPHADHPDDRKVELAKSPVDHIVVDLGELLHILRVSISGT